MSPQRNIRPTLGPRRFTRVLRPVKHVHLSHHRLGRDQVRVLWHVTGAVHFAGVVDRLDDLDAGFGGGVSADFCEEWPEKNLFSTGERGRRKGESVPPRSSSYFSKLNSA
jgi:hypothetical protein